MADYIFTGETLDGEIVEGDLVHDGQDKTYILMDVMDHIKRDDYAVYMVEVRPSSVRLTAQAEGGEPDCSKCKWAHGKDIMTGIGSDWPCDSCMTNKFEPQEG